MLVFDATALEALFHGHTPLNALWHRADEGLIELGFPALAVLEAGIAIGSSARDWDAVLWPEKTTVLPLGVTAAVEIASWSGTLAARHTLWEALHMECPIVTRDEGLYAPGVAMVLQV